MNTLHWQDLADALRREMADYGGLLRLFEQQQESLLGWDADSVVRLASAIEAQASALSVCRRQREEAVATFAQRHGLPASSTLRSLFPVIEPDAHPLLDALIREVNRLLERVRRAGRHNHALLARAVELNQETLQLLQPQQFTRTYSPAGRVSVATSGAAQLRQVG